MFAGQSLHLYEGLMTDPKILALFIALMTFSSDALDWPPGAAPRLFQDAGQWKVAFSVTESTDVEVSIVNPVDSSVVRHLAAGKLGANPPAPLTPNSLSQTLAWDGRDDLGAPVADPSSLQARVRAGMGLEHRQVVGGDPYALYVQGQTGLSNSFQYIAGMDKGADGSIFVFGKSVATAGPYLRQYSAKGEYVRTLFPIPGVRSPELYSGYGLCRTENNGYAPTLYNSKYPQMTLSPLNARGDLIPVHPEGGLALLDPAYKTFSLNADGSVAPNASSSLPPLVANPPIAKSANDGQYSVGGPFFSAVTKDRKHFFLSGLFRSDIAGPLGACDTGFWRDGRVFKVDMATRTAAVFFSIDTVVTAQAARTTSGIDTKNDAELHGVAVDDSGRVFVCDRLFRRVLVLDGNGAVLRALPLNYPDAVAVSAVTGALYVTTRYSKTGVFLHKYPDWRTDTTWSARVNVTQAVSAGDIDYCSRNPKGFRSELLVSETDEGTLIWCAFQPTAITVYRDAGTTLPVYKDFLKANHQNFLSFNRMTVDPIRDRIYIADGFGGVYKLEDWGRPSFAPCSTSAKKRIAGYDLTVDLLGRNLYVRQPGVPTSYDGSIWRYTLDHYHAPVLLGASGSNRVTDTLHNNMGFTGHQDHGIGAAPNGDIAVNSVQDRRIPGTHARSQFVSYFKIRETASTYPAGMSMLILDKLSGGVCFDLQGNLYAGNIITPQLPAPMGYATEWSWRGLVGAIYKYTPTGTLSLDSTLFPAAPTAPAVTYRIPFGSIGGSNGQYCTCENARFFVDGFGRIYTPNSVNQKVSVSDNNGNTLQSFGTYGNIDDINAELAGAEGYRGRFFMAFPMSVAASEDYIYTADLANQCLLKIRKTFALDNLPGFTDRNTSSEPTPTSVPLALFPRPNPFNSRCRLRVALPLSQYVRISVCDLTGRQIRVLAAGRFHAGSHEVLWDGNDSFNRKAAAGVYFYRLAAGNRVLVRRVVLSR